ncbi:MAG: four helix bundle protein [Acidobacteria bacterium]|nr:MAG: four helix bundle protein [Acidobacteriota bacterium]
MASNIVGGAGRGDDRDLAPFLRIIRGFASELAAQTDLIVRLSYFSEQDVMSLGEGTGRIIKAITTLERRVRHIWSQPHHPKFPTSAANLRLTSCGPRSISGVPRSFDRHKPAQTPPTCLPSPRHTSRGGQGVGRGQSGRS